MNFPPISRQFSYASSDTASRIMQAVSKNEDPVAAALKYSKNPLWSLLDYCFDTNHYAEQDTKKTKFAVVFLQILHNTINAKNGEYSGSFYVQDAQNNQYAIRLKKEDDGGIVLENFRLDITKTDSFRYSSHEVTEIDKRISDSLADFAQSISDDEGDIMDERRMMALDILINHDQQPVEIIQEAMQYLHAHYSDYENNQKSEINEAVLAWME